MSIDEMNHELLIHHSRLRNSSYIIQMDGIIFLMRRKKICDIIKLLK
jgi:hypothetical protein